jgi:phosphoglycolate phosphatase
MHPPSALLLDWDNTLVDTLPAIAASFNAALKAAGRPAWSHDEVRVRIHRSAREGFRLHFGEQAEMAQSIYYETFSQIHLNYLTPMPGMAELLPRIKGVPVGVVSNKRKDKLMLEIQHLGWEQYFGAIVGAGECAADKPDPAPVLSALQQLNIPCSKNVWLVGDSPTDMETAHNAGICGILVHNDAASPDFSACIPTKNAQNYQGLIEILENTGVIIN